MDPANWAGVPIQESGEVVWKTCSNWKIVELLPLAVRGSLTLYAGELLLTPQRRLWDRYRARHAGTRPADAGEQEDVKMGDAEAQPGDGADAAKGDNKADVSGT